MDRDELRAADADRQAVVDRLHRAQAEGRLDLLEYDERLARAYAARTYGELDALVADLPPALPAPAAAVPAPGSRKRCAGGSIWTTALGVNLLVWLFVCLSSGSLVYFWPMWVALPALVTAGPQLLRRLGGRPR